MRKKIMQNSKKGFSLPVAIGISAFLIIIAASLLFISLNSTSTTSAHINSRQAYLNVRSAIEYAQSYYNNNVTDYSKIGTEYMVMNDEVSGTTSDGAYITKTESDAQEAITYVVVEYIKGTTSKSQLRLTAFSRYSDSFGNRAAVARLSISFTIGSTKQNRLTVATLPIKRGTVISDDRINLHVKKPTSMDNFDLTYYVWTFYDSNINNGGKQGGNAYSEYKESNGNISLTYDNRNDWGFYNKLNSTTQDPKNIIKPNAEWMSYADSSRRLQKGPNGIVSSEGNNWYSGTYFIRSGRVPWFNIIFAQRGSTINDSGIPNNIYDSQTNEMFHLWYLDPSDKNIYFEFTGRKDQSGHFIKYYEGKGWNGKDGLEDTIVVYVNNPKTLIHFAVDSIDYNSTVPSDPKRQPKVTVRLSEGNAELSGTSYLTSTITTNGQNGPFNGNTNKSKQSSIDMQYEGCGWWVANIETIKEFNLSFTCPKVNNGNAITINNISTTESLSTKNREFWFVYKTQSQRIEVSESEEDANSDRGVDMSSYVTVHAKVANPDNSNASPKLTYKIDELTSSSDRMRLLDTLQFYSGANKEMYEEDSYNAYMEALDKGWEAYENKSFISSQPGKNDEEKLKNAKIEYDRLINNIKARVKGGDFEDDDGSVVPVEGLKKKTAQNFTKIDNARKNAKAIIDAENARLEKNQNTVSYNFSLSETDKLVAFLGDYSALTVYDSAKFNAYKVKYEDTAPEKIKGYSQIEVDNLATELENATKSLKSKNGGLLDRQTLSKRLQAYAKYYGDIDSFTDEGNDFFDPIYVLALNARNNQKTNQSDLDTALDNLTKAKKTLLSTPEYNKPNLSLNTEKYYEYISQAENYLKATSGYTEESRKNLEEKFNAAETGFSPKMNQAALDDLTNALRLAIEKFEYPVPEDCINQLAYGIDKETQQVNNKFRVWIYSDELPKEGKGSTFRFYAYPISSTGSVMFAKNAKEVKTWGDKTDETLKNKLGYYYIDLDMSKYRGVSVEYTSTQNKKIKTETVNFADVEDKNLVFVLKNDNATVGKLVSLYARDPYDDAGVEVRYDGVKVPGSNYKEPYYVARMVYDPQKSGKVFSLFCKTSNSGTEGYTEKEYSSGLKITKPGDYIMKIAKIPGTEAIKTVSADIIYPFVNNGTNGNDNEPQVGGTLATEELEYSDLVNYQDEPEVMNVANYGSKYEVYFSDYFAWGQGNVRAYFWDNNGKFIETDWPGNVMTKAFVNDYKDCYGHNNQVVYKITVPRDGEREAAYVIFSNNGNSQTDDIKLNYNKIINYYPNGQWDNGKAKVGISERESYNYENDRNDNVFNNDTNYNKEGFDEDELRDDSALIGKDNQKNRPMAYVGGNKVRLRNKSYVYSTNQIKKSSKGTTIYSGNLFGGSGGAGGNNDSDGRLGNVVLSAYYDWYEFKIPVSPKTKYTFALSGMDPANANNTDPNKVVQTKTVSGASGDVWLEQVNNDRGSKTGNNYHYANINVYTFDPESKKNGTMPDKFTVYFRVPSEMTGNIPKIQLSGPFGTSEYVQMKGPLSRSGNSNIYYYDEIGKNTPFLTFMLVNHEYTANLQGGDKVLFDPQLNQPDGDWETFISDRDRLFREVERLRSTYYSNVIYDNQNSYGDLYTSGNYTADRLYSCGLAELLVKDNRPNPPKEGDYAYTKLNPAGGDYYIINEDFINGLDEDDSEYSAWKLYCNLKNMVDKYEELYEKMMYVRAYIENPLNNNDTAPAQNQDSAGVLCKYNQKYKSGIKFHVNAGGKYYEYRTRTNLSKTYETDSINYLRKKLAEAEVAYLNYNSTYSDINKAIQGLKKADASLVTDSEGSICCILYDVQDKKSEGYRWKLKYRTKKKEDGGILYETPGYITDFNPEKFPIVFLSKDYFDTMVGVDTIYDVSFVEYDPNKMGKNINGKTYEGDVLLAKDQMKMDSIWVYMDDANKPSWEENSVYDYRQIDVNTFTQEADKYKLINGTNKLVRDTQIYKMKTEAQGNSAKQMTLLFSRDTTIDRYYGQDYIIKAGAYTFTEDNVALDNNINAERPLNSDYAIDLFTDAAKNYFTNPINYGEFDESKADVNDNPIHDVVSGTQIGAFDNEKKTFKNGTFHEQGYVNIEYSSGSFKNGITEYVYEAQGIYFRWSTDNNLIVKNEVVFRSDDIRIATGGGYIDGTGLRSPHFYLCSGSGNDSTTVTFLSDVLIKYKDDLGKERQFAIREGTYIIRKNPDIDTTYFKDAEKNVIADLFDIQYWRNMEYITYVSRTSTSTNINDTDSIHSGIYE